MTITRWYTPAELEQIARLDRLQRLTEVFRTKISVEQFEHLWQEALAAAGAKTAGVLVDDLHLDEYNAVLNRACVLLLDHAWQHMVFGTATKAELDQAWLQMLKCIMTTRNTVKE